jgi:hypothetical protein
VADTFLEDMLGSNFVLKIARIVEIVVHLSTNIDVLPSTENPK